MNHVHIFVIGENLQHRSDIHLFWCIVISGNNNDRDTGIPPDPQDLTRGESDHPVGRAHGMKQVSGVDDKVGFEGDYLVDRLGETVEYVLFATIASGSEVIVGKMTDAQRNTPLDSFQDQFKTAQRLLWQDNISGPEKTGKPLLKGDRDL
jgi:hypothetical protein